MRPHPHKSPQKQCQNEVNSAVAVEADAVEAEVEAAEGVEVVLEQRNKQSLDLRRRISST